MTGKESLKPLHQRIDFILSIAIPATISIIIGFIILNAEAPKDLCLKAECFDNFIKLMKVPIAILALAFPLAGMVAAYHRSMETNEQIKIALSNNNFSNFIKHRDDFIEYLNEYLKSEFCNCLIIDPRKLYTLVYPDNTYNSLQTYIDNPNLIPLLVDIENINKKANAISSAKYYWDDEFMSLLLDIEEANKKIQLLPKRASFRAVQYSHNSIEAFVFSEDFPLENIAELNAIAGRIRRFNHLPVPPRHEWSSDKILSEKFCHFIQSNAQ
ncbi:MULTISPECIES: hypothetical protein [Pseudomonas]|uniref:hypothetical protein n=1 Tax=Pseudomonas TaxID=286 RepID=UPI0012FA3637|nr:MULTISPECIES: hypothetical protein [Pseudomonas]MDC7830303.1 hypothetical protein [Pseudomonas benzopyrenica]